MPRVSDTLRTAIAILVAAALGIAGLHVAAAAVYYVSDTGNDKKGNGSKDSPWRSLQRATDQLKAGDQIMVTAGKYEPFHVEASGKPEARIIIKASEPGVRISGYESFDGRYVGISILASYVTLDGFDVDVGLNGHDKSRGIRVSGTPGHYVYDVHIINNHVANAGWVGITASYAENIHIEGNHVHGSRGQHGIYVANSADNPVIRHNVSFGNAQAGIQVNADPQLPGDGIIEGAIIEDNILHHNGLKGSAALNLASVRNSTIAGNLLYKNFSQGIASWDDEAGHRYGCKGNVYLNNTVVMPEGSRHALVFRHGSSDNTIYNNILIHLGDRDGLAFDSSSMPNLRSDNNIVSRVEDPKGEIVSLALWHGMSGLDQHSLVVSPARLFLNYQADDYTLASDSPAIDRGLGRPEVLQDLRGTRRPQGKALDIGAYEHPEK